VVTFVVAERNFVRMASCPILVEVQAEHSQKSTTPSPSLASIEEIMMISFGNLTSELCITSAHAIFSVASPSWIGPQT
jgi:hypothetical protein